MNILRQLASIGAITLTIVVAPTANAQISPSTCQVVSTVCVDPPPPATSSTRMINGYPVTRTCWNYQSVYNCTLPNANNTNCTPLVNGSCGQTTNTCTTTAFSGACLTQTSTWNCSAPPTIPATYTNITQNPTTYQITQNALDTAPCNTYATSPSCTLVSTACIDSTPTKNINGLNVSESCWLWNYTYSCAAAWNTTQCNPYLSNSSCTNTNTSCISYLNNPTNTVCGTQTLTFQCQTNPGATTSTTSCNTQQCVGGVCFDASYAANQNFGKTIAAMEMQREAGGYMNQSTCTDAAHCLLFNGLASACKTSLSGLFDCCSTGGGAPPSFSNYAVQQAVGWVGEAASYYVMDMITTWSVAAAGTIGAGASTYALAWDMVTNVGTATLDLSTTFGAELAQYMAGTATFDQVVSSMNFNVYAIAIMAAVYLVETWAACTQEDELTDMRKASNLCYPLGSYCSSSVNLGLFSICVQNTNSYCCYNSQLAEIINVAAHSQLGLTWGSAQSPNCTGVTPAQIASIDFSRVNWSSFIASIQATMGNLTTVQSSVTSHITSYFGSGTPTTCPSGGC